MIEAATLLSLVSLAHSWLAKQSAERARRDAEYRTALDRLGTAVNATEFYLHRRREGSPRSEDKESDLSALWDSAGRALRHINPTLARRCRIKGKYWADPAKWTSTQIDELDIRLKSVAMDLDRLMADGKAK